MKLEERKCDALEKEEGICNHCNTRIDSFGNCRCEDRDEWHY